jgi:putative transcriptional regulator
MAIVVKLDDMLHARRMTLTELAERIDITLANLSILKTGKARAVRFSTLDAICDVLQCQPGDLLEFAPSSAAEDASVADSPAASSAARLPLKRPLGSVPEEA